MRPRLGGERTVWRRLDGTRTEGVSRWERFLADAFGDGTEGREMIDSGEALVLQSP